jgi:hypothetical protein
VDFTAAFGEEADTKRKQKAMKRRRADEMNEDYDEDEEGGLAGRLVKLTLNDNSPFN